MSEQWRGLWLLVLVMQVGKPGAVLDVGGGGSCGSTEKTDGARMMMCVCACATRLRCSYGSRLLADWTCFFALCCVWAWRTLRELR